MQAKYIVIVQRGLECIIIFPEIIDHKHMAMSIADTISNVISAGFVRNSAMNGIRCYGYSVSLDKFARPLKDANLAYDLLNG